MKKLILILLYLSFFTTSFAQLKKVDNPSTASLIVTGGGVAMSIGAFLTPVEYQWVGSQNVPNQSNSNKGVWEVKPFYKQGARFYGACGGITLTVSGAITFLTTKKR